MKSKYLVLGVILALALWTIGMAELLHEGFKQIVRFLE